MDARWCVAAVLVLTSGTSFITPLLHSAHARAHTHARRIVGNAVTVTRSNTESLEGQREALRPLEALRSRDTSAQRRAQGIRVRVRVRVRRQPGPRFSNLEEVTVRQTQTASFRFFTRRRTLMRPLRHRAWFCVVLNAREFINNTQTEHWTLDSEYTLTCGMYGSFESPRAQSLCSQIRNSGWDATRRRGHKPKVLVRRVTFRVMQRHVRGTRAVVYRRESSSSLPGCPERKPGTGGISMLQLKLGRMSEHLHTSLRTSTYWLPSTSFQLLASTVRESGWRLANDIELCL